MPSPACEIKEGAGAYQSTDDGFDATPASTITIHLLSGAGVNSWSISCVYTDDTSDAATVTAALTIDTVARTAVFTAPAAGKTYIFRSQINGGVDANGRVQSSYTTTFGVYTLTAEGLRVIAANETTEGSSSHGWAKSVNDAIRASGGGGGGADPTAGVCTLEDFGAVGDGVTDDQAAYTAAFAALAANTYRTILLGAKTYLLGSGGNQSLPAGCSIIGQGQSSILKTTTDASVIKVAAAGCTLLNFRIEGDSGTSAQIGVQFGTVGVANSCPDDFRISGVYAYQLGWGFTFHDNSIVYQGGTVTDCTADACTAGGFWFDEAEYITCTNCQSVNHGNGSGSPVGVKVGAGNIVWAGGSVVNCGLGVEVIDSVNAAHGIVSGCEINHCSYPVKVSGTGGIPGHSFVGCHIYYGDIWLINCTGITFRDCTIDLGDWIFQGSTGTRVVNCTLPSTLANVIFNSYLGSASSTTWINPRKLDGTIPSWVDQEIHLPYTFSSDADKTLTAQESVAEILDIQSGVISTGRTITSAIAPMRGNKMLVRNGETQTVTFKWSSGTGVAVASGASALVGSDGTNAISLSSAAGSFTAPTGTGVVTVTGGALDAASTGTTGTGNFVRATQPTLDRPVVHEIEDPTAFAVSIGGDGIQQIADAGIYSARPRLGVPGSGTYDGVSFATGSTFASEGYNQVNIFNGGTTHVTISDAAAALACLEFTSATGARSVYFPDVTVSNDHAYAKDLINSSGYTVTVCVNDAQPSALATATLADGEMGRFWFTTTGAYGPFAPASGGFTAPTGTGFVTVTSGSLDAAASSAGTGVMTFLATPSSANLAAAVTDETGSGALVFANTPTLVTPVLGAATATSVTASSHFSAGSSPPASGLVRLGVGGSNVALLHANTTANGDIEIFGINGTSGAWRMGTVGGGFGTVQAYTMTIDAWTSLIVQHNGTVSARFDTSGPQFGSGTTDHGGGVGVIGIDNAGTNPTTNPTAGGILYADGGAGKWRGSSGTVTTFGPADLDGFKATSGEGHCPSCGTDFALEWANDAYGSLTVCMRCLADTLGDQPWIVRKPKGAA